MSQLQSRVGSWNFKWMTVPRGNQGIAKVEVRPGEIIEVRWALDSDGLWLGLPHGIFGFDFEGRWDDEGRIVYHVRRRDSSDEWTELSASFGETIASVKGSGSKAKGLRVRAQMPGKIIRVLVKDGDTVRKDQPVLVMEAMKMENEIRASTSATVKTVRVLEGQTVETGADLVLLESS